MVFNASEEEKEDIVRTLLVIQPNCTEAYARQILEKSNWNVDQAATTLLDTAAASVSRRPNLTLDPYATSGTSNISNPPPARPNSVIDLTMDEDEDLATVQAVEASLNSQPPSYGPANLDKSSWALVPSNGPPVLTQEERALNEALEASLTASFVASQEPYEEPLDVKERLRKTGFPVALRSTDPGLIHVPVVMQCLLSIPKIQERIRMYSPEMSSGNDADHNLYKDLQRVSACLAMSARAYIPVDSLFEYPHFDSFRVSKNHQPLAGSIREYYQYLARYFERTPCSSPRLDHDRLLEFQGGTELEAEKTNDFHIEVNVPTPYGNDLMSCLAHSFSKAGVFLSRLSECFVFLICRDDPASPLKYPSRIYMDRFFKDNIEHANKLMLYQEGVQHEIQKLITDRHKITNWQNHDTLKAFRSSLYYFENLVNDNGDLVRRAKNEEAKSKLRSIITEMEANVQYLDTRIKDLTLDVENLFDTPDFQKYPYDLNAVLMHDGLFGRSHLYSYTKNPNGMWWKILDYHVSEVSEDAVLNDQFGLHLGGGPVLLLYTKPSNVDPGSTLDYPRDVLDMIDFDNQTFLSNPSEPTSQYVTPNETPAELGQLL